MNYDEVKALFDAETNPAIKQIYGNHLARIEGKKAFCGGCDVRIPLEVIVEESVVEDTEEE